MESAHGRQVRHEEKRTGADPALLEAVCLEPKNWRYTVRITADFYFA